jgi:hypothetical protein
MKPTTVGQRAYKKRPIPTTYTGTHRNAELDAYIES